VLEDTFRSDPVKKNYKSIGLFYYEQNLLWQGCVQLIHGIRNTKIFCDYLFNEIFVLIFFCETPLFFWGAVRYWNCATFPNFLKIFWKSPTFDQAKKIKKTKFCKKNLVDQQIFWWFWSHEWVSNFDPLFPQPNCNKVKKFFKE